MPFPIKPDIITISMIVLKSDYKYRFSHKKILCKKGVDKKAEINIRPPPPPNFLKIYGTSTAPPCQKCTSLYTFGSEFRQSRNIAFDKCSTYQRYASALFSPNFLYLNHLFPKKRTPKSKQHNFFTTNQLSHKTRKKIFRSCFLYRNVLSDWDSSIQIRGGTALFRIKVPFLPYDPTFLQKNRLGVPPLRTPPINGVFRGRAPKQTEKDGGAWGGRKTRSAGVSFLPKNRRGV